jgi:MFS family permease
MSETDTRRRFLALFSAVMLPMFLAAVDQTVLALAVPAIAAEFDDRDATSWLAVGYLLASVSMVPLYGRLADRHGRRRLLGVALGVFAAGSLATLLAPTMPALIAARALQGAGGAGLMSLSHALIGEVLAPRERARYQAYFAVLFASASLVGPVLGGVVVQLGDWRWLFAANLPLCAFAGWRLARLRHVPPPLDRSGRVDVRGGLLFIAAAGGSLWMISRPGGTTLLDATGVVVGVALIALLWTLLWRSGRQRAQPYLPFELLSLPVMRRAAFATLAYAAASYALVFYLPAYAIWVLGSSATEAGVLLVPLTGGTIVGAALAGRVVLVTGRTREPPLAGLVVSAVCLAALGLLPPSRSLVLVLGFVAGTGLGMVMSVTQIISQVTAGPTRLGAAAAVISLSRNLGAATGAAAFGAIAFGLSSGGGASTPGGAAEAEGFARAFLAAAGICVAGAWAASGLPAERLAPERASAAPPSPGTEPPSPGIERMGATPARAADERPPTDAGSR